MIDETGTSITTALASVLPNFNLSEAQTETYPYSVYTYEPNYLYDKDGLNKITSIVNIRLVGKDLSTLETYASAAHVAIAGLTASKFQTRHKSVSRDRMDGIWTVNIEYQINQIS